MRVNRTFVDLAFGTPRRRHKGQRRHGQHALRDSATRGASTGRVAFSDRTHDGERATGFTTIGINRHCLSFLFLRNQKFYNRLAHASCSGRNRSGNRRCSQHNRPCRPCPSATTLTEPCSQASRAEEDARYAGHEGRVKINPWHSTLTMNGTISGACLLKNSRSSASRLLSVAPAKICAITDSIVSHGMFATSTPTSTSIASPRRPVSMLCGGAGQARAESAARCRFLNASANTSCRPCRRR
jgi:hypothetical protein